VSVDLKDTIFNANEQEMSRYLEMFAFGAIKGKSKPSNQL
jgi:hypothetical protein